MAYTTTRTITVPTRRLTVSMQRRQRADGRVSAPYPAIYLAGQWLTDIGLAPGDTVEITPREGGFDLRRVG